VVAGGSVLAVAASGALGGAERVLVEWLAAVEAPVVLACPPGPPADAAVAAGITVVTIPRRPLRRRGRTARAAADIAALGRDVARLARRHRPALVVASGQRPLLAAASAPLAGARMLALLHDLPPGPAPLDAALRAATTRAAAIVATSGAIARAADPAGRRLARTHVVHPGVDLERWAAVPPPAGTSRALVLGALVPWKRADLALEVATRLPGLMLDFAGASLPGDAPGYTETLFERANRPDLAQRVRFLGGRDDPRPALAQADLLLHCADREPFGLALVEALAAGRPVVAAAAGGPLELVTPACGRLFPPGDAAAAAAAVTALLSDPPAPEAIRARAAEFDGRAAARRFAAIVEQAAAHADRG